MPDFRPDSGPDSAPDSGPGFDFPDVATSAAGQARPPGFDALARRASARRRRRAVAGIAAVALVVAGIAVGSASLLGDRDAAHEPLRQPTPTPRPSPGAATDPAGIVARGHFDSVAVDRRGDVLSVWRSCRAPGSRHCRYAWQLQPHDGAGPVVGAGPGGEPNAYAAGASFVLRAFDHDGIVVDAHGRVRPLSNVQRGTIRPGDVMVAQGDSLMVVDPRTATGWPMPSPARGDGWAAAAVSPGGVVYGISHGAGPGTVRLDVRRGGATTRRVLAPGTMPGYLAVGGAHAAALASFDGATVLPVGDLAVTSDDGRTWTDLGRHDVPLPDIASMVATSDGTLFMSDDAGEVYRTTDSSWTRFTRVGIDGAAGRLLPGADGTVVARVGWQGTPRLVALDGAGHQHALAPLR